MNSVPKEKRRRWTLFRRHEIVGVLSVAMVLTASNYCVRLVINDWLTWGAFIYPMAFLVTDCLNRIWGSASARRVVIAGFMVGLPISLLFNLSTPEQGQAFQEIAAIAIRISCASGAAFLVAHLLDIHVFSLLRKHPWWMAPALSSSVASICDTFLFFSIAFAFTEAPWMTLALGDLAAKAFMVAFLLPFYRIAVWTLLDQSQSQTRLENR